MLTALEIHNFRCIESARLDFDPRATGIIGENASGKTSLLEAIHFLAHGRSFRTNQREKLLRTHAEFLRVVGHIDAEHRDLVAGVEYSHGRIHANLGGQGISGVADIAEALPVQIIDPGVHRLIEEASARRRRLLDWGVFHVKHEFLHAWRRYQRALQQRNAALKTTEGGELVEAWDAELVAAGERIDMLRQAYASELDPHFKAFAERLLTTSDASLIYRRGWPSDIDLQTALNQSRAKDGRLRTTTTGAHRADLSLMLGGSLARDKVSRGQQKLLAAALILAQVALHADSRKQAVCLMLDDPAAELDVDNLGKLLASVVEIPAQLILTSVHERALAGIPVGRRFHVKQGAFDPML